MTLATRSTGPRIAVTGGGYWGRNLVRNFAELSSLAAICDHDLQTAEALSAQYKTPSMTWTDVLADQSIDAIVIATPAETHFDLATEALMHGKDVFIEKPMALDSNAAERMLRIAAERGKLVMVGHLLHYHPVYERLYRMATDGDLGQLRYIHSSRASLGKIRHEENVLWSFAPHDLSMVLGLALEEPNKIEANEAKILRNDISDTATVDLSFPSGLRAHIFVSWLHPFKEQRLIVVGDKAMAVFDDTKAWSHKLEVYPHRIDWRHGMPMPHKAEPVAIDVAEDEPLKRECQHFMECVMSRAEPRTNGREGLRVLKVLEVASKQQAMEISRMEKFSNVKIHESAYIDEPAEIGEGTRIWHFSHILPHVKIGRNGSIGQNVMIGPHVTVGDNCKIQNNVSLYQGVTLEDNVFCGPSCVFTNVNNPRSEIERKDEFQRTLIKRGASIGANATIVCGHTLGEYCFIAAGATVTKDVPAFALMAGTPAHRIGWISKAGARLGADLICPIDGSRYRERGLDRLEEVRLEKAVR